MLARRLLARRRGRSGSAGDPGDMYLTKSGQMYFVRRDGLGMVRFEEALPAFIRNSAFAGAGIVGASSTIAHRLAHYARPVDMSVPPLLVAPQVAPLFTQNRYIPMTDGVLTLGRSALGAPYKTVRYDLDGTLTAELDHAAATPVLPTPSAASTDGYFNLGGRALFYPANTQHRQGMRIARSLSEYRRAPAWLELHPEAVSDPGSLYTRVDGATLAVTGHGPYTDPYFTPPPSGLPLHGRLALAQSVSRYEFDGKTYTLATVLLDHLDWDGVQHTGYDQWGNPIPHTAYFEIDACPFHVYAWLLFETVASGEMRVVRVLRSVRRTWAPGRFGVIVDGSDGRARAILDPSSWTNSSPVETLPVNPPTVTEDYNPFGVGLYEDPFLNGAVGLDSVRGRNVWLSASSNTPGLSRKLRFDLAEFQGNAKATKAGIGTLLDLPREGVTRLYTGTSPSSFQESLDGGLSWTTHNVAALDSASGAPAGWALFPGPSETIIAAI